MGLFSFAKPSSNDNNGANQDIQLIVNSETITVPAAEAAGLTVRDLFTRFADGVADVARINRFVNAGSIIDGSTLAVPGTVYSGAIASEAKG